MEINTAIKYLEESYAIVKNETTTECKEVLEVFDMAIQALKEKQKRKSKGMKKFFFRTPFI